MMRILYQSCRRACCGSSSTQHSMAARPRPHRYRSRSPPGVWIPERSNRCSTATAAGIVAAAGSARPVYYRGYYGRRPWWTLTPVRVLHW